MKTPASDRCRSLLEQLSKYIDDDLTPRPAPLADGASAPLSLLPDHGRQPETYGRDLQKSRHGPPASRCAVSRQSAHRDAARDGARRKHPYVA